MNIWTERVFTISRFMYENPIRRELTRREITLAECDRRGKKDDAVGFAQGKRLETCLVDTRRNDVD